MGQLLTRITSISSDQETSTIINDNNSVPIESIVKKRKYFDYDQISKKRKLDENNRFIYSSRPKSSILNQTILPLIVFKCQLCEHCFSTKDAYLNHLILCANEHHASIKIVRANSHSSRQS